MGKCATSRPPGNLLLVSLRYKEKFVSNYDREGSLQGITFNGGTRLVLTLATNTELRTAEGLSRVEAGLLGDFAWRLDGEGGRDGWRVGLQRSVGEWVVSWSLWIEQLSTTVIPLRNLGGSRRQSSPAVSMQEV